MSTRWTWKQAVADLIIDEVNYARSERFSLDAIFAREQAIKLQFPKNSHIRPKIRQVLQRLRDDGLVLFAGNGVYELNLEFHDLEIAPIIHEESEPIKMVKVERTVRLRNSLLAGDLKKRYKFCCQICQKTVRLVHCDFAEAHHIRPLGAPHHGPDIEGNILVVCPNHHVMLDRGAIYIDERTNIIRHWHNVIRPTKLFLAEWHVLHIKSLQYYMANIYGR